jgi:alkylation response protein AidB-like acyl-CoA dehydrogenase
MLDLQFSEEQEMLRETVRGVCASTSPLGVVRQLEDDPVGYSPDLWKQLAHLDLIGLQLPEEFGGSGMSTLETVVLYEEFGRSLAPSPHFVSAILSGGALARSGSDDLKAAWLPRIVTGEAILTPAWLEPENGFGPKGVQVRAVADGDGFLLSGVKRHVAFARAATALVVLARTGDDPEAVDLFVVETGAPGVTLTQQMSIASDAQYRVDLDQVRVTAADRIGPAGSGWVTWNSVMHDGIILAAAQAVGGAQYAMEITTQYAKDRHQFDKPLGAFQALAHYLADATTAVDGGLGPLGGPQRGQAGPHGQAVRLPDLPGRDGHRPADLRRHRLHRGVRHPAVLPPGQAAPDLVVGHPLPGGAGCRGGARRLTGSRCTAPS